MSDNNDSALPIITMVPSTWTSPNGVALRLKKVSRYLLVEIGRKVVVPKPPIYFNEEKGREEENPLDPTYLEAITNSNYERAMTIITAAFSLGTEIVSLPEDMPGPQDDEWLEIVESLNVDVPKDNKKLRYTAWLKYIALDDTCFNELLNLVLKFSGLTTEAEVTKAQEGFRGETKWGVDLSTEVATKDQSEHNN